MSAARKTARRAKRAGARGSNTGEQLRPEVALFSSTAAEPLLNALKRHLGPKTTPRSWREVIRPGQFTLAAVQNQLQRSDFAIVLATADAFTVDLATRAGVATARPNIVVEIGLALGALGRDRVFIVRAGDVTLPSELDGFTYVSAQQRPEEAITGIARAITADIEARGLRYGSGEVPVEEAHRMMYAWMRSSKASVIHHLSPTTNHYPTPPIVRRFDDEARAFVARGGLYCYLFADAPHKRERAESLLRAGKAARNAMVWRLRGGVLDAPFLGTAIVLGDQLVVYFDQSDSRTRTFVLRGTGSVLAFKQTFTALRGLSDVMTLDGQGKLSV